MPRAFQTTKPLVQIGRDVSDCWEWQGSINKATGYGKKQVNGKPELAHRWIWMTLFGPIPKDKVINHKCGNRSCVNPHHLEVVSQAENCRHGAGSKLTKEQVEEIRRAKATKRWGDGARLARKYGVSAALIHDIWSGRAWQ